MPGQGRFVVDEAGVLTAEQAAQINDAAAAVKAATRQPIYVVTMRSLASKGAAGTVEPYATALFNHWRIGSAQENRGVLLLLSVDDRKARIELGAGWPPSQSATTDRIMRDVIVPHMKRGEYGPGLLEGVRALGEMSAAGPTISRPAEAPDSPKTASRSLDMPSSPPSVRSQPWPGSSPMPNGIGPSISPFAPMMGFCWCFGAAGIAVGIIALFRIVSRSTGGGFMSRGSGLGGFGGSSYDSWGSSSDSSSSSGFSDSGSSSSGSSDSGGSSSGGGSSGSW